MACNHWRRCLVFGYEISKFLFIICHIKRYSLWNNFKKPTQIYTKILLSFSHTVWIKHLEYNNYLVITMGWYDNMCSCTADCSIQVSIICTEKLRFMLFLFYIKFQNLLARTYMYSLLPYKNKEWSLACF